MELIIVFGHKILTCFLLLKPRMLSDLLHGVAVVRVDLYHVLDQVKGTFFYVDLEFFGEHFAESFG